MIQLSAGDVVRLVEQTLDLSNSEWIQTQITKITSDRSKKDLYLTYSQIATKVPAAAVKLTLISGKEVANYLEFQRADLRQLTRVYLFTQVLKADEPYFGPLIANIIQVADTKELETFLKYLPLLPNPAQFKLTAVDALRTNIATVFDALAIGNPYPARYFDENQWNQMYLKAAFMERDLTGILSVDQMANGELARIISDYAHERWEAGREVPPYFWRPVGRFLNAVLLRDMRRLFGSRTRTERRVAALCCRDSDRAEAKGLLDRHPDLASELESGALTWESVKEEL